MLRIVCFLLVVSLVDDLMFLIVLVSDVKILLFLSRI